MSQTAKIFTNGRSQAVRLPADWESFFQLVDRSPAPPDFLDRDERGQEAHDRDPFEGMAE